MSEQTEKKAAEESVSRVTGYRVKCLEHFPVPWEVVFEDSEQAVLASMAHREETGHMMIILSKDGLNPYAPH